MANSPSVIRGRTARLIRLQKGSRRDYNAHDEKGKPLRIGPAGLLLVQRCVGEENADASSERTCYPVASSQLAPTPMSTTSGTLSCTTFSICCRTSRVI